MLTAGLVDGLTAFIAFWLGYWRGSHVATADEREACAVEADKLADRTDAFALKWLTAPSLDFQRYSEGARQAANCIRARAIRGTSE